MNEDVLETSDPVLQEIKNRRETGELTLFFGALAGVGKTYTMLRNAKELLKSGTRVCIGYVEMHGRAETERLTQGIPSIAPKKIVYRGSTLYELDIDAILEAKPDVVLIDELAHSNAPTSRHQKRYQDVLEILDNGIDVYSTMNVQHLESLNDLVLQITGVKVTETVPDSILERVDKIQIIDIPPEKLVERLKEGKIYKLQSVEKALMNFFKLGNINALREIALKQAAGRVSKDVYELYKENKLERWEAVEKVMVCIDGSEFSANLIRYAKRLSSQMNAEWIALYVDDFSTNNREKLAKNIRLAEELGAEVNTVSGQDVGEEILKHARARFVTHIVVAKRKKNFIGKFWRMDIADELLNAGDEFCIISYINKTKEQTLESYVIEEEEKKEEMPLWHSLFGLGLLGIITFGCIVFRNYLELLNVALLILIPVLIVASRGDMKTSMLITFVGVGLFNYFFVPPIYTFVVTDISHLWSFFIFFIVAYLISSQAKKLKLIGEVIREREKRVRRLYKLSRRVTAVSEIKQVIKIAMPLIAESLGKETFFFLRRHVDEMPKLYAHYDPQSPLSSKKHDAMFEKLEAIFISSSEKAVLDWCLDNGKIAGAGTDTFLASDMLYIPIQSRDIVYGALGIKIKQDEMNTEFKMFLDSVTSVMAVSFERISLSEKNSKNAITLAREELKNALYGSISHDLRTPLASILGMVSMLKTDETWLDEKKRVIISQVILSAKKMERLMNNLLDSARFESHKVVLKKDWCDVADIFSQAAKEFEDILKERNFSIKIEEESGIFKADCVLIERVVVNLLENAIKYSQHGSAITLGFQKEGAWCKIFVLNEDSHISDEDLKMVFEKFFRIKGISDDINGSGLGLFICKKIVEAHGGTIWARNVENSVIFEFNIPIEEE
ncbi:sensor histidine kinase [Sulfurospirillum diekertiae]|uniref:sensor histidine kinase n=1 Tax=Sulfurospirillum diekertiae TaxID=1854492 RepID=UPI000B4DAF04|nr:sensor histidine kinase KdpD [Sulfurospirillum diekertiae]ASC94686.1 Sensor protein KdpD [Sulfurospirillum diekertiae]